MGNLVLINKIMIHLWFIAWMCLVTCSSQQFYDTFNCTSTSSQSSSGTNYNCNSTQESCKTFLVYRANQNFQTILQISKLFNKNIDEVLHINNLTSSSQLLKQGKEILLPIDCTCSNQFYQTNLSYKVPQNTTLSEVACDVYEGLLKHLKNLNPLSNEAKVDVELHMALKCACPQNFSSSKGIKYLVTYPIIQGDDADKLSRKFNMSHEDFLVVNHLNPFDTLFPKTVVLIPLRDSSIRIFDIPDSPSPPPGFLPTIPIQTQESTQPSNLYIAGSIIGFLLFTILLASGLYMKRLKKSDFVHSFNPTKNSSTSTTLWSPMRGSTTSCLSPEILLGIKYCLLNYHIEEVEKATKNFSEENKIGDWVYKGLINNLEVMIKRIRFEDTRQVIDLHSKINHISVVKLLGVCYGENEKEKNNVSWCYLVFELPKNGCLRKCLFDPRNVLNWCRRRQIAFDIATCLYYLHYCSFPCYAHMNVSSRNIFITGNWRAKLADVGGSSSSGDSDEKVDVFSFGVVLLELISGRDDFDGKSIKDSIGFLLGEASEGLMSFMDCNLKDYCVPEALCLCFLAKDCVADDPLHRPTMDDIMKVLAKINS